MINNFKKPILLFFPMDMLSHHLRCLQLADSVKDIATCVFSTQKHFDLIQNRGHEVICSKTLSAEMIVKMGQQGDSSWVSLKNLKPVIDSQIEVIKEIKPDYVINDFSFTAHLAAEFSNIPCVSLINGLFSKNLAIQKGIPPSHPMAKFAFFFPDFLIRNIQEFILKMLHQPYRQLRKIYGLSLKNKSFMDEFQGNINLVLDTIEFAPQTHLPHNSFFLGPIYHTDSKIERQILNSLDQNKKTILINMGSGGLIERAGFLNNDSFNQYNIIVVGDQAKHLKAKHFIHTNFLSLESILPKVDLVLTQGGTGNIFQSLSHGVPVFCYPTFFEQDWNAIRVQSLGYGLHLTGNESVQAMTDLVELWSGKKSDLKFELLKDSVNVEETKLRFRRIMQNQFQQRIPHKKQRENSIAKALVLQEILA